MGARSHLFVTDGRAVVEVSDTGVGIPPEELPHVFERFHRVPNARSRTHEGTGIGLALVQELVRLHGGAIGVASVVDQGTTFTIELPFGADHLASTAWNDAPSDTGDSRGDGDCGRVHPRRRCHGRVRARSEAEEANGAKSEFLAAMSHELRTPLNAIGGYAQLFEMGLYGPVSTDQQEALGRVQRSRQHLLALINDDLNFAKLEAGRVEYDVTDIAVSSAIDDVVHMVEPQLRAKGIACDVRPGERLYARADREKLEQILLNLLSNAIRFTDAGGRITIDTPTANVPSDEFPLGRVFIRVSDTGCGIPRDKQDAIFDPFVQVNRRLTTPTEGTGLGLAISRDLARGMGGNLRVRSWAGEGAAFTLTLLAGTN